MRKKATFTLLELLIVSVSLATITGLIVGFFIPRFSDTNEVDDTMNKIIKDYYGTIDKQELSDAAIKGMMDYLNEKHSKYLSEDETIELNKKLDSSYEGVGITIYKTEEGILVNSVYDDTPAKEAGIKPGDIITNINDVEVTKEMSLDDAKNLIKDKKEVTFKIKRNNKIKEIKVKVKTLEAPVAIKKIFESNNKKIGYIYLETFAKQSYNQVKELINSLDKENIDGLIFDVRSNTGGYLDSAKDILSIFERQDSVLFKIQDKNDSTDLIDTTSESKDYPIVVLIDGATASAAEVLALSLKENNGAIIVGTKSYGKGTIQKTSSLKDDSMIKYTYAKWLSPEGNSIDGIGITPGIEVKLTIEYAMNPIDNNDTQLKKAIEILSN